MQDGKGSVYCKGFFLLVQHFFTYSHYLVDHGDILNIFVRIGTLASSGCSDRNG